MKYNDFCGLKISALGMGTMRLPLLENGQVDAEKTGEFFDALIEGGVNYFDTAYPYHGGTSETVTGQCLKKYPRESYYLADKYPGHQHFLPLGPAEIFEEQLKKCGTDYFDFYLLHNVNDSSIEKYMDPAEGIVDYFEEQKRKGRIRFLGFSSHATPAALERYLKYLEDRGSRPDFVQIQLNYLDWTLQDAEEKVRILNERNIPVWVMEPVRGGCLANLPEKAKASLAALESGRSDASWAMRWLMDVPGVTCVLSGMSTMEQVQDNLAVFSEAKPLSAAEKEALAAIAEEMKSFVPCTGCRYCTDACPAGINIPFAMKLYNDLRVDMTMTPGILVEGMEKGTTPYDCLQCGSCVSMCPQQIDIPRIISETCGLLDKAPNWKKICAEREEARRKAAEEAGRK